MVFVMPSPAKLQTIVSLEAEDMKTPKRTHSPAQAPKTTSQACSPPSGKGSSCCKGSVDNDFSSLGASTSCGFDNPRM
jgi:hypothetical protein